MINTARDGTPGAEAGPVRPTGDTKMSQILQAFPGARRALFARYHIGGCQSCAFSPDETLGEVCARNDGIPVGEAIAHIVDSHEHDRAILVTPSRLAAMIEAGGGSGDGVTLLDVRTREEFEAVSLPGANLLTQELTQQLFGDADRSAMLVVYDHTGDRCLDAAAYLIGHGFSNTRALAGGIDAYAAEIDRSLPRYKIELEG